MEFTLKITCFRIHCMVNSRYLVNIFKWSQIFAYFMLEYDQSSVPLREMLKCPKTKRRRTPKHSQSANTHYSKELIPLQPQNRQWGFIQGIVVQILHCCLLFVNLNDHAQKTCFSVMKLCFCHSVIISSPRLALSCTWQTPPQPWT